MIEWDRQEGTGERGEDMQQKNHGQESNPGLCAEDWALNGVHYTRWVGRSLSLFWPFPLKEQILM